MVPPPTVRKHKPRPLGGARRGEPASPSWPSPRLAGRPDQINTERTRIWSALAEAVAGSPQNSIILYACYFAAEQNPIDFFLYLQAVRLGRPWCSHRFGLGQEMALGLKRWFEEGRRPLPKP